MKTLKPRLAPSQARGWKPDALRGNRHQRGYGREWERLRREVLHRDGGLCQPCLERGHVTQADQVDHKVQKADGGSDDPSNLQAICTPCHREKTSREANRTGGG